MEVKALADKINSIIMFHVCEFDDGAKRLNLPDGTSVVKHLDDIGFLDSNVLFAHAIYVSDEDPEIMQKRDVAVACD